MADNKQEKDTWPELVGRPWKEAENIIRSSYKNITIQVLSENSPCTMDYCTERVRIIIDGDGKVVIPPTIG
ncbi:uncharacterized protein LOC141905159 [Tubulanus polymorphus]|uniref:uncharacterized protein LOC141905159 n=1 Tax=Tubulanus polymorphus TaxID=672921 RepID=UPI003DA30D9B